MNINITIGNKTFLTIAIVAAFLLGSQSAEAASSAKPKVLCVKSNGSVQAKAACGKGETRFSVMPGTVTTKQKKTVVLTRANLLKASNNVRSASLATSFSTLSVLSSSPRVYTQFIEIPAGTPMTPGGRPFGDDQGRPLPGVGPTCPSDAPWMIAANARVIPDNAPGSVTWGSTYQQRNASTVNVPGASFEPGTLTLWQVEFSPFLATEAGASGFDILVSNGNDLETNSTPRAIRAWLSVTCVPTVELTAAP